MIVFPGVDDGRGCRNMSKMLRGSNLDERQLGVGGGCLVGESTGHLGEGPFYVAVRVRDRACCNGH